jgi:2-dehydropantoate 2-reductase
VPQQFISMEKTNNPVYIVGAGAIGKTLAVCLAQVGGNVCLVRGSVDDTPSVKEQIAVHLPGGKLLDAIIETRSFASIDKMEGIIVLTNKSFGNQRLAAIIAQKAPGIPVVLLQNGLGIEKPFEEAGNLPVYRCVLFATSQQTEENVIRFKPVAISPIGIIKGYEDELQTIVHLLNNEYFQFGAENNIQPVIWKKVITNVVFNSVCPLLNTDNGIFQRDENALRIANRIIAECITVCNASGIALEAEEVETALLRISKMSDGQLISTLQDINLKRPTEIDTLNFEIVRRAVALGLDEQVKETKLLGELTQLRAQL